MSGLDEEGPPSSNAPTESSTASSAEQSVGEISAGADINSTISAGVSIADVDKQCRALYTENKKAKTWTKMAKTVETYSDKTIKRWIDEIDTYLVFAGLFSAILTAFNVPAYALLNPPDPAIFLLQQISSKLDGFSVNSTQPSSANSPDADIAPPILRWAVWLNGLWFSGLILSLTSAAMGLMSKQWLNECSSGISETSRHAARMRQYRLENLRAWHVAAVVNTIPILLQLSLACFLAGLLIFLWNLHNTVAAIASTLVGLLAIFFAATTLLPLLIPRCAYLSPQTRTLYYMCQQPRRFIYWVCTTLATLYCSTTCGSHSQEPPSLRPCLHRYFKGWKAPTLTWQRREWSGIDNLEDHLDLGILCEAYRITLHPDTLSAVTVCLTNFAATDVVDCFRLLHKYAQEHFGPAAYDHLSIGGEQQMLWLRVILGASLTHSEASSKPDDPPRLPLNGDETAALDDYLKSGSWSSSMQAAEAELALSTLDALTDYCKGEETGRLTEEFVVPLDQLREERGKLLEVAIDRKEPLKTVVQRIISGVYDQVLVEQVRRAKDPSNLKSLWHQFLEYASRALTPVNNHSNDREIVRAYTSDVLIKLTHALLELLAQGRVRIIIESTSFDNVMRKLRDLDNTRVGECIPDELVPDISRLATELTRADEYADDDALISIQISAYVLKTNIARVKCQRAVTWAYEQIRVPQKDFTQASSDETRVAHRHYLQCVDYFLECAYHAAATSSLAVKDMEIVRVHTRDVLTQLTRAMLELFTQGEVRTTIESTYLDDIMKKLRNLDETRVGECIPDELVPDILDLAEKLATAADYHDNRWVGEIQESARTLKANIARVPGKCKCAATWARGQICVPQKDFTQASSYEIRVAHRHYLQCVGYFLECVNHAAATSSLSESKDLDAARVNDTQDVLTQLTRTLLELFTKGRVRTAIESTYLDDIMRKLRELADARVEEYIPAGLVLDILDLAERLATAADYYDNSHVDSIQHSARSLHENIDRVKYGKPATAWAYSRVHLRQKPGASFDETRAAYTSYLKSVDYFLECANRAPISSRLPADDPETVRTYARDILTKLTHTLLELFTNDQVRTTIESAYLNNIMRKLRDFDDARVEEYIPDELVPRISDLAEELATAADYDDDRWVHEIQDFARALKANIARAKCNLAATWAYRQARLQQKPGASLDEARAAYTIYLQSVDYFLECANRAPTSSRLPADNPETVRTYARDILTKLTHTLLELFTNDQVRTTIQSTYLDDIMRKISNLDDARVEEYIPEELVPDILNLAERLATATDYLGNRWVDEIQDSARALQANIARVKCNSVAILAYHQVRLQEKSGWSSIEARAAYTSYLQSVVYFLDCANRVVETSPGSRVSDSGLETVLVHAQQVLTQLTRTLLKLFAPGQVRTTIQSTYLDDVMRQLRDLDDTRVGEYIPDGLVPEILDLGAKLAMAEDYADADWVQSIQRSACSLVGNINHVKCGKPAEIWAYEQVRLRQKDLKQASSYETMAAHRRYLQRVDYFLECANHAVATSSLSDSKDLDSVRVHTQDVLTQLTHTLLKLFTHNEVRTTIESTYLDDVMRKLRDLDDTRVGECIPDELVPAVLDLAEKLAMADEYADDDGRWVKYIQTSARTLKVNIDRVKCRPGTTTSPETPPAPLSVTEPVVSATATIQPSDPVAQVEAPSGAARDPECNSQDDAGDAASSRDGLL